MSRRPSSVWIAAAPWCALLIVCIADVSPLVSRASINPLKKAKDAVTKPAEKKAAPQTESDEQVVFDEYTLELTEARIQGMLVSCKKAAEALAARQPIVDKLNKVTDDRGKLDEKEGEKVRELQRKRGDVEVCHHDAFQVYIEKHRQELTAKVMSDPTAMQEFNKLAQEQSVATAKNDSAASARATAAMMKWGAPTKEESLAVKQKCGPIPPHSAAEDQLAAYDKQIADLNQQLFEADEKAAKEQAKASGMNPGQWGTARERIASFLRLYKPDKPEPTGFTDAELDALEKNVPQLQDAQKSGCL